MPGAPDFSAYPALEAFEAWRRERGLTAAPSGAKPALEATGAVELRLEAPGAPPLAVIVFDEYGDARPDNPWLCLILAGLAFEGVDDAYADWLRAELIGDSAAARQVYDQTLAVRAAFLARFGPIPDPLAGMDWELNAGAAQLLRRL